MQPLKLDLDPAAADPNGIAEDQQPAAGGVQSLTLDGALCDVGTAGTFDVNDTDSAGIKGRKISITTAADESLVTFTVTGTNPEGAAQVMTTAGPNATTTEYPEWWRTITSITVSADATGNIAVGTIDEACSATIPLNWRSNYQATVAFMGSSGTFVIDVEETFDQLVSQTSVDVNWLTIQADVSADGAYSLTRHARGFRVHFDSYTATAETQAHMLQN